MPGTIHIVNLNTDDCSGKENFFYCGRSKEGNPLANPFTFNGKKSSLAKLSFKTRDEAIEAYGKYFRAAYGNPGYEDLTRKFDEIYEHYKNNEDIYLGCWCQPLPCHTQIIAEELQKKLVRETLATRRAKRKDSQS
jgi:hypothetical protein